MSYICPIQDSLLCYICPIQESLLSYICPIKDSLLCYICPMQYSLLSYICPIQDSPLSQYQLQLLISEEQQSAIWACALKYAQCPRRCQRSQLLFRQEGLLFNRKCFCRAAQCWRSATHPTFCAGALHLWVDLSAHLLKTCCWCLFASWTLCCSQSRLLPMQSPHLFTTLVWEVAGWQTSPKIEKWRDFERKQETLRSPLHV